jgi:hypothetical protein
VAPENAAPPPRARTRASRAYARSLPCGIPANARPTLGRDVSGHQSGGKLAKHKFGFEKRQRELNKERKRAEKQQRKLDRANEREPQPDQDAEPTPPEE